MPNHPTLNQKAFFLTRGPAGETHEILGHLNNSPLPSQSVAVRVKERPPACLVKSWDRVIRGERLSGLQGAPEEAKGMSKCLCSMTLKARRLCRSSFDSLRHCMRACVQRGGLCLPGGLWPWTRKTAGSSCNGSTSS
jgi:hypothetical protein